MNLSKYNNLQVVRHWLAAAAIGFPLITGIFVLTYIDNANLDKINNLRTHMLTFDFALALILSRIF